jgi:hypothetical protein
MKVGFFALVLCVAALSYETYSEGMSIKELEGTIDQLK